MRRALALTVLALAACATEPAPAPSSGAPNPFVANRGTAPPPPSSGTRDAAPPEGVAAGGLDFGAWRSAEPGAYETAFAERVRARAAGRERAQVRADLERNGFRCAEGEAQMECRIEIMESQCARDWYVVVDGAANSPHAGYDVMCLGAGS
ncbi:MAG: hypothetical protein GC189_04905 [Alphaproteobacteria bacterium]|nr:hypothetical protein [Alphaproteobacteria bacterium]